MRKLILLFVITLIGVSCTKNEEHEIKYQLFIESTPSQIYTYDGLEINCSPSYGGTSVQNPSRLNPPKMWEYTYIGLKSGDVVKYSVMSFKGNTDNFIFTMKVLIDGNEVSSLVWGGYIGGVQELKGINNNTENLPYITFNY